GNFPLLSVAGLDVDRLTEMNNRLATVGPTAWELSRLFGEPQPDADATSGQLSQLSRLDQTLGTMQSLVADYQTQATQVRRRTEALQANLLRWITPAAVIVSVVCFWIALSQISLLCHAWSWWKR